MDQRVNYGDQRQTVLCAHCGDRIESRDHVPSRVFLDEPYPPNLPVVGSCSSCNGGLSRDEEYVACVIDYAAVGRMGPAMRPTVLRILESRPKLRARIERSAVKGIGESVFVVEVARISSVILKLARGHALFELNEPQWSEPTALGFQPLSEMDDSSRQAFEEPLRSSVWPEVGSRAMQLVVVNDPEVRPWIEVQANRYRYTAATVEDETVVRIVIREYLAAEVVWSN